jgi:hypothetical protein
MSKYGLPFYIRARMGLKLSDSNKNTLKNVKN